MELRKAVLVGSMFSQSVAHTSAVRITTVGVGVSVGGFESSIFFGLLLFFDFFDFFDSSPLSLLPNFDFFLDFSALFCLLELSSFLALSALSDFAPFSDFSVLSDFTSFSDFSAFSFLLDFSSSSALSLLDLSSFAAFSDLVAFSLPSAARSSSRSIVSCLRRVVGRKVVGK